MRAVLGVDGWPGGWLGARVLGDGVLGDGVQWLLLADAAAVLAVDVPVVGIDIPVGLPGTGRRTCDLAARAVLGPARSSVFLTPVRGVLAAATYPEANALSRTLTGRGLSKQTWNILDRIRDVDDALGEPPDPRLVEVHPEVSFRTLDARVAAGKKSAAGAGQRIRALSTWIDVAEALAALPPGPGLDDALDALVAAWSAARWAQGVARELPTVRSELDARGRPMLIAA